MLLLILRLGDALTVGFEQILIQRQAVGRDAAEVLDTFAYYYGVVTNNFSYGAAAGLFKGVLSLMLILGREQARARLRRGRVVPEMTDADHRRTGKPSAAVRPARSRRARSGRSRRPRPARPPRASTLVRRAWR